jgi:hypothetical protein
MDDKWECAARRQGTAGGNDPADCDWPVCGCDPHASKVIEAIEDRGVIMATDRALEVVLSRCRMSNQTASDLKYLLAMERAKNG